MTRETNDTSRMAGPLSGSGQADFKDLTIDYITKDVDRNTFWGCRFLSDPLPN